MRGRHDMYVCYSSLERMLEAFIQDTKPDLSHAEVA